jgi:two-component system sensor histidine kinase/response regulator
MKKNILLVDDEPMVLEVTARMLRENGFIVEEASSGSDALKLLHKGRTNLLITDMQMPGMNGVELIHRAHEKFPDIEVIIVSAYGTEATRHKLEQTGVFGYIDKPIQFDKLSAMALLAIKSNRVVRLGYGKQTPEVHFNRERILVVDDNPELLEILSRILFEQGYKVTTAINGSQAYEMILVNDYDLIILDINMPKMNGVETVKAIRYDDPDTFILLISGEAEPKKIQEAMALGANTFIPKPLDFDTFLSAIKKIDFQKINTSKQKSVEQDRKNALKHLTWYQKLFHPYRLARIRHEILWIFIIVISSLSIGFFAVNFIKYSTGKSRDKTADLIKENAKAIEEYRDQDEQREIKR